MQHQLRFSPCTYAAVHSVDQTNHEQHATNASPPTENRSETLFLKINKGIRTKQIMPGVFGRPTRVCSVRSDGRPVISGHVRESSLHSYPGLQQCTFVAAHATLSAWTGTHTLRLTSTETAKDMALVMCLEYGWGW